MVTRFLASDADLAAEFPDARPPRNGLPWHSEKLGFEVLVSDQNGCVFLIARHDPLEPKPSRLVRKFFAGPDGRRAAVAVNECVSEEERAALLTPIQTMIATFDEEAAGRSDASSHPVEPIDLDATAPTSETGATLGEILQKQYAALREAAGKSDDQPQPNKPFSPENAWHSRALHSFFLANVSQFNGWFPEIKVPNNILPNHSGDRSTFVFTAFDDSAYYAMLVREDLELSRRSAFVREAFNVAPSAYAWVIRFDDWLMRDTFALGLQCRLFGTLLDRPGPDSPIDGDDAPGGMGPRGRDDDTGVPVRRIRPTPTRSGSDAKELPEEEDPEEFFFEPVELAETPAERELVPARVEGTDPPRLPQREE